MKLVFITLLHYVSVFPKIIMLWKVELRHNMCFTNPTIQNDHGNCSKHNKLGFEETLTIFLKKNRENLGRNVSYYKHVVACIHKPHSSVSSVAKVSKNDEIY